MRDELIKRLGELIQEGPAAATRIDRGFWVRDAVRAQSWMMSAVHVIKTICPAGSIFVSEADALIDKSGDTGGVAGEMVDKVLGVLKAVQSEASLGLLRRVEDAAFATAFDDFLDHAQVFHKAGAVRESAVLVSVVLEDAIKRICLAQGVVPGSMSLESLIDELVKADVFTGIKAKRVKGYAAVRNAALHAKWDELDLREVGQTISGVRALLDEFLGG